MTATQSGPQRMFQVRVHLEPRQELLRTLWNAYKAFQGEHEGGGLRDFTRALKLVLRTRSDKERAQALSAYTRVILALGAQSGFDPFNKACGEWKKDASLRKSIASLKSSTLKEVEEFDKDKKGSDAPEVRVLRQELLRALASDCDAALGCLDLFKQHSWYPFAELKRKHSGAGSAWFRQLVMQAIAHESSYVQLMEQANVTHKEREIEIKAWKDANPLHRLYLDRYRTVFVKAEQAGKIRGHTGRLLGKKLPWLYLDWLRTQPELVKWRDATQDLVDLDLSAQEHVAKANPRKKAVVAIAKFLDLNPELAKLDSIHGDFDQRFAVRVKGALMPDDYKTLPTYTEPEALYHARGIVFSAPQTSPSSWKDLSLCGSVGSSLPSVTLRLPTVDLTAYQDHQVRFHPDKRFRRFFGFDTSKGLKALYRDPHTREVRDATFQGIRLRFTEPKFDDVGEIQSAKVYLDFVVDLQPKRQTVRAKATSWKKSGKKALVQLPRLDVAPGTRVGMVCYDPETIAWVTAGTWDGQKLLCTGKDGFRTRLVAPLGQLNQSIAEQARLIAHKKRMSGGTQRGQRFAVAAHKRLQDLQEQRLRHGVADILHFMVGEEVVLKRKDTKTRFARGRSTTRKVDVVVIGSPEYLKVFGGRYKRDNRQRAAFAAMTLHERLVRGLQERGIRVLCPERYGYAALHSKCGALGIRYYVARPRSGGKALVFSAQGNKFACPSCSAIELDARYNASISLLRACTTPDFLMPYREYREWAVSKQEAWNTEVQEQLRPRILEALGI